MSTAPSTDHRARLMHPTYDRRAFLRRAGLATAGAAMVAGMPRPAAAQDPGLEPFLHGVASGDPVADGVILWTRVTPADTAPVPVTWRVANDVEGTRLYFSSQRGPAPAGPGITFEVRGPFRVGPAVASSEPTTSTALGGLKPAPPSVAAAPDRMLPATGGPSTGAVGLGAAAAALLMAKLRSRGAHDAESPLD